MENKWPEMTIVQKLVNFSYLKKSTEIAAIAGIWASTLFIIQVEKVGFFITVLQIAALNCAS